MDPTGNLKKVNRYVLRAVSISKTKNKRTFKEICKYVRYYNRNCVPIENLEHSVLMALHNLTEQGLIEKDSKDSFRFRDFSSKKKFQSIINKVINKNKQKSKNLSTKVNHNVSTKNNVLPTKSSVDLSTSSRNRHKPNIPSNLRLNLKTNSRKRKLSNDGGIRKRNNLRGAKRLKLSKRTLSSLPSDGNVVNMRRANTNLRRTKKKTSFTDTAFLESGSDSDIDYCDNGNFYMYYPSDDSEVEDNISYGGDSNKTEESKLETDQESANEQNDEENREEEEDVELDENNDENVSTVNSNTSIKNQEEVGSQNYVNEISEKGEEEENENNEQLQEEVNSNCSTEQNQIENDKENDEKQYE